MKKLLFLFFVLFFSCSVFGASVSTDYLYSHSGGELHKIKTVDGSTEVSIGTTSGVSHIAVDTNTVWVLDGNILRRINLTDNTVDLNIIITFDDASADITATPTGLVLDKDYVWVAIRSASGATNANKVIRFKKDGTFDKNIDLGKSFEVGGIVVDGNGFAWVSGSDLMRITVDGVFDLNFVYDASLLCDYSNCGAVTIDKNSHVLVAANNRIIGFNYDLNVNDTNVGASANNTPNYAVVDTNNTIWTTQSTPDTGLRRYEIDTGLMLYNFGPVTYGASLDANTSIWIHNNSETINYDFDYTEIRTTDVANPLKLLGDFTGFNYQYHILNYGLADFFDLNFNAPVAGTDVVTGTYSIDLNIVSSDSNSFVLDINYSTAGARGGTVIVNDQNSQVGGSVVCDSNVWSVSRKCTTTWTLPNSTDGNYYIVVDINNGTNQELFVSNSFTIDTNAPNVPITLTPDTVDLNYTSSVIINCSGSIDHADKNVYYGYDTNYGGSWQVLDFNTNTAFTWDISGIAANTKAWFRCLASDLDNNSSYKTTVNYIMINPAVDYGSLNNAIPSTPAIITTASAFFEVDGNSIYGNDFCTFSIYKNYVKVLDVNGSNTDGNTFSYTHTNIANADIVYAEIQCIDVYNNKSSTTSTSTYTASISGGDNGGDTPSGGGGGGGEDKADLGEFCISSSDCITGLVCLASVCSLAGAERELDKLVVSPPEIVPSGGVDVLPDSLLKLPPINVINNGQSILRLKNYFSCAEEKFCAKEWCYFVVEGTPNELVFDMNPKSSRKVSIECVVPSSARVGEVYKTTILFQGTGGGRRGVELTIPIRKASVFSPTGFLGFAGENVGGGINYGLVCLGDRGNCLYNIPNTERVEFFGLVIDAFTVGLAFLIASAVLLFVIGWIGILLFIIAIFVNLIGIIV